MKCSALFKVFEQGHANVGRTEIFMGCLAFCPSLDKKTTTLKNVATGASLLKSTQKNCLHPNQAVLAFKKGSSSLEGDGDAPCSLFGKLGP